MKFKGRFGHGLTRFGESGSKALLAGLALALVTGCGGSTPEPATPADDSPEHLLSDEPEGAAPASSADVQKGIDAIAAEDFAGAKEILLGAVAANPKDPQAMFYLGVAESGLGETDAAIGHLRTAVQLDPKLAEASLNLSALLLDQEKYDEALDASEQGLAAAPNDTGLLQNKAMALLMTGKEADSAPLFGKVVEKKPDDEGLRFMYAQALLAAGSEDEAKGQLDTLASSKDVAVLASVADLFGRLKSWDGCVKALDGAIAQKSAGELFVKRGLCKHGKKDEDGAKADFEKAIELEPTSAQGHFYLGHNKRARGDKKGAKAAFSKAAELDPDGKMGKAAKAAAAQL